MKYALVQIRDTQGPFICGNGDQNVMITSECFRLLDGRFDELWQAQDLQRVMQYPDHYIIIAIY